MGKTKRTIAWLVSLAIVIGASVSIIRYDRNFDKSFASIDEINQSFKSLSKIGTNSFSFQEKVEFPAGFSISSYVPQNTNVNISEMYLIHSVKYMGFKCNDKFLLHSNYCEEKEPVGIAFVEYDKDSTAVYLYSSNKLKISKIQLCVKYDKYSDNVWMVVEPNQSFAKHCLLINQFINYLSFICYDAEGNVVYTYNK